MMEDFQAINYVEKIPYRSTNQRGEQSKLKTLLQELHTQEQKQRKKVKKRWGKKQKNQQRILEEYNLDPLLTTQTKTT